MKTQEISLRILAQVNAGKSIKEAVDAVLGQGTYDKIAGDVWESLRQAK